MTAPVENPTDLNIRSEPPSVPDTATGRVVRTCRAAIDGRRAARVLAAWAKHFELSEPEFQLLWSLRPLANRGVDQSSLARRLALSPAQVSATVERLRRGGWIFSLAVQGDRRRRLWQLTGAGHALLAKMLVDTERLRLEPTAVEISRPTRSHRQEEAA